MTTDLASRRPIRKVTRADLQAYPVWEWALNEDDTGGQGESLIRPTGLDRIPAGSAQQYIVAATAILNDGSRLPACAEVTVGEKRQRVAPLFLFLQEHHLDFGGVETTTMLSHYTKVADTIPLRWELAVPLAAEEKLRSGSVRRGVMARLARLWSRLRAAAHGKRVLAP
jgi:hypothetical protein